MQDFDWITLICNIAPFFIFAVMSLPIIMFMVMIGRTKNEEIRKEREKKEKYKQSIRDNGGVLAPASIVGARVLSSSGRGRHGTNTPSFVIEFEAEVNPSTGLPFRTKFRDELFLDGYRIEDQEMISEYGKKIWVIYDPKDASQAFLDHYDEDHEKIMRSRQ